MCAVAQTAPTAPTNNDPRSQPYNLRYLARAMGNIGGWWSFLNETEKSAFLDGYQSAMDRSYAQSYGACKILKDGIKPSSDQEAFMNQLKMAMLACEIAENFNGFDKVTVKDLDEFYSDPVNQPMLLEWSMPYLRDKATGRKTAGQLLDALQAEQKDVHDCTKYPGLCKLGIK
jgi:hypothetical protein